MHDTKFYLYSNVKNNAADIKKHLYLGCGNQETLLSHFNLEHSARVRAINPIQRYYQWTTVCQPARVTTETRLGAECIYHNSGTLARAPELLRYSKLPANVPGTDFGYSLGV